MQPRFRQDLVAEAIEEQGAKFIEVADPDGGHVFRFFENEFSLACGMDGERDIAGLVKWARDELGMTATPSEIQSVIATLGDLGYLDAGDRPEAPTEDVPLMPGVVVGPSQPVAAAASTNDVALGRAGANARPAPAPLPRGAELELGLAGASATPKPPRAPAEDIALGAPGASQSSPEPMSDVSLDLSDHIAVKRDDVKEAVRQSKVMTAVEMPKDLLDSLDAPAARPPERMARPPVTPPPRTPTPLPIPPEPKPVEAAKAAEPAPKPERTKPVTAKPADAPSVAEKSPVTPLAPRRAISPVLLVLLILLIAGGAGFMVWKYIIDRTNESDTSSQAAPPTPTPTPPQPPPEPPKQYAKGKVTLRAPGPKTLLSMFGGTVEWIEAKDKPVKAGDVVMRLVGYKQLDNTVQTLQKDVEKRRADIETLTKQRDDAQAAGKDAELKAIQAKLTEKENALSNKDQLFATKRDDLEQFVVRVTRDGVFTPSAKVGQKIPENTPIASLQQNPEPSVTLEVPDGTKMDIGSLIALQRVGAPEAAQPISCTVSEWEPKAMRVSCAGVPDLAEGTELRWQLP